MVFKAEPKQGVRIIVGTYRKSSGAGGSDRHGRTGKSAMVHMPGKDPVRVRGATLKELRSKIGAVVPIPTSVTLNSHGETSF